MMAGDVVAPLVNYTPVSSTAGNVSTVQAAPLSGPTGLIQIENGDIHIHGTQGNAIAHHFRTAAGTG